MTRIAVSDEDGREISQQRSQNRIIASRVCVYSLRVLCGSNPFVLLPSSSASSAVTLFPSTGGLFDPPRCG